MRALFPSRLFHTIVSIKVLVANRSQNIFEHKHTSLQPEHEAEVQYALVAFYLSLEEVLKSIIHVSL